jgi:hypothetical protein
MTEKVEPKLKPAEENPWYVLATICDKQDENDKGIIVDGRAIENCEVWNSWAWARLQENGDKGVLKIKTLGLIFGPKWEDIRERVEERLKKRLNYDNFRFLSGHQINLDSTIFTKKVKFTNFIFPFMATFKDSLIFSEVVFDNSIFYKSAFFDGVKFNNTTSFVHTVFFGLTHFNGQVDFMKNNTFAHSVFYYHVSFSGAIFRKRSNFRNCEFKKTCDFTASIFAEEYPWLEGTYFNQNFITTAHKYNWPNHNNYKQPLQEAKASCEILRAKMEAQGLHEQAHFFFRREMQFASKIVSTIKRLPYQLFGLFSDYGHSLKRPAWALGFLWFLPALIYAFWLICLGCVDCNGSLQNCVAQQGACQSSALQSVLTGSGLSLSNILQFTGLQRAYFGYSYISCLPSWMKFLGGLQTLLAIPLLFLLLLGLRNRFRLK